MNDCNRLHKEHTTHPLQEENEKYSRISVIPLNTVTDYEYFTSCLYRSLNTILPTNLVKQKHQLVDVRTVIAASCAE